MWLQMREDEGALLVYFHQVKHMWVGYADGRSGTVGEDKEAGERQAKAQILTARRVEPKQVLLWMQMQRDAQVAACVDSTSRTVEAHKAGLGHGAVRWGDSVSQQGHGRRMGPGHGDAPDAQGYGHGRL